MFLAGEYGTGKTTLAYVFGQQFKEAFPESEVTFRTDDDPSYVVTPLPDRSKRSLLILDEFERLELRDLNTREWVRRISRNSPGTKILLAGRTVP